MLCTTNQVITDSQRELIRRWKAGAQPNQSDSVIPIRAEGCELLGRLIPVTERLAADIPTCQSLTRWRHRFMKYFTTQFESTPERTQAWLRNLVLLDDSRILFLICEEEGRAVGNFGVCGISRYNAELDNLIRGEKGGHARLIYYAELALLDWIFRELDVVHARLHVFSNNVRTRRLHESVGFLEEESFRLECRTSKNETRYDTQITGRGKLADFELLRMRLRREDFYTRYPWI